MRGSLGAETGGDAPAQGDLDAARRCGLLPPPSPRFRGLPLFLWPFH